MSELTISAAELLHAGELTDVRFFEVSGAVLDEPIEEINEDEFQQRMTVKVGREDGILEIRVDFEVDTQSCKYRVVAATQFLYEPADQSVSVALGKEFAERVGVMAVYPYVREAISSLATRLRQPPITLPLMRSGELDLGEAEDTDATDPALQPSP